MKTSIKCKPFNLFLSPIIIVSCTQCKHRLHPVHKPDQHAQIDRSHEDFSQLGCNQRCMIKVHCLPLCWLFKESIGLTWVSPKVCTPRQKKKKKKAALFTAARGHCSQISGKMMRKHRGAADYGARKSSAGVSKTRQQQWNYRAYAQQLVFL